MLRSSAAASFLPRSLQACVWCQPGASMATSTTTWKPNFLPIEGSVNDSSGSQMAVIRLVSYNILAQAYVKSAFFPHSPSPCLRWKAHSQAILARLLAFKADILCLQELDEYESFYKKQLDTHGYSSVYIKRSGKKRDGCGIFYQRARVALVLNEFIDYNDLVPPLDDTDEAITDETTGSSDEESSERGDPNDPRVRLRRDCVGILAAFRVLQAPQDLFVLANTHIYWDPDWVDVKLAQAKYLVTRIMEFQSRFKEKFQLEVPVMACGDFNSVPGDQVYNYLHSEVGHKHEASPNCSLRLHSLYGSIKGEPAFTNCTPDFTNTLDYIFLSSLDQLKPLSLLEVPLPGSEDVIGGLPNYSHPSDHLPIGTDIAICLKK